MTGLEFSSFSSRIPENTTSERCACPDIPCPSLPATGPLGVSGPERPSYQELGLSHRYRSTFRDGAQREVTLVRVDFRGPADPCTRILPAGNSTVKDCTTPS